MKEWKLVRKLNENTNYKFWQQEQQKAMEMEIKIWRKVLKYQCFFDGTDMIDSYIQRFERFAQANSWRREEWAQALSTLLTGKALDVYSRLSDEDSCNYEKLKSALL